LQLKLQALLRGGDKQDRTADLLNAIQALFLQYLKKRSKKACTSIFRGYTQMAQIADILIVCVVV